MRKQLKSTKEANEIAQSSREIWAVQSDLKSLLAHIDSDWTAIADLHSKVEVDRKDSNTMFEIANNWQQGLDNSRLHLRSFP